ncbi:MULTISPECIES: SDR family NAD(P)-dependent oxidoreductase [unclassified Oceanispirochaeta]|uniref:SDR family NAD(P)-dependent oxidoreductase n=1 Tax=unclassified Oceanispirochaeta TaxID=2635722 RepID=UPI001314F400|nr:MULTISPECIES: SDR family NAD(P)-dependent oxidoreductase [unclassified Oceanispirochaeta]MBF9015266.1 SDR family NAD(P)-dependent oxidoreductase [Oceanispirochaeta sp. M2]NPD71724.1 SDR family NAD(P)-dependent oxidoreductase [Oceanispirochaeta sp. M1]
MSKTVLIIGSETLLGRKLIEVYLNSAYKVIAPVMTTQETLKRSEKTNLQVIPWNRSSLVSAKTVMREVLRNLSSLDKAIVVNPEISETSVLEECETEKLDEALYTYTHGTLYLIKEILDYFKKQEKGILAFAETEKGLSTESIIPSIIRGGFHNMAESILLSSSGSDIRCAFTSRLTEMEDYAQFIKGILKSGEPKINGEWLQFSEKKALFQSLPIIKRK